MFVFVFFVSVRIVRVCLSVASSRFQYAPNRPPQTKHVRFKSHWHGTTTVESECLDPCCGTVRRCYGTIFRSYLVSLPDRLGDMVLICVCGVFVFCFVCFVGWFGTIRFVTLMVAVTNRRGAKPAKLRKKSGKWYINHNISKHVWHRAQRTRTYYNYYLQ